MICATCGVRLRMTFFGLVVEDGPDAGAPCRTGYPLYQDQTEHTVMYWHGALQGSPVPDQV